MINRFKILLPLLIVTVTSATASVPRSVDPIDHKQAWDFRASLGVGGFWGAPRVYARPVTVGAYAECQWVHVTTAYGPRWQAICD